jgi:hypothetical protein
MNFNKKLFLGILLVIASPIKAMENKEGLRQRFSDSPEMEQPHQHEGNIPLYTLEDLACCSVVTAMITSLGTYFVCLHSNKFQ